jgi:hypothetical protein
MIFILSWLSGYLQGSKYRRFKKVGKGQVLEFRLLSFDFWAAAAANLFLSRMKVVGEIRRIV